MKFISNSTKPSVQVLDAFLPTIIISKDALAKIQLYCELCNTEIGWLGTAFCEDKSVIYIADVFLFKQDVHSTTTEITPEGLSEFAEELLQHEDGLSIWNNIRLWGHSHVNMSTTPSTQDNEQMVTFAEGGHDWFVRMIANKKGDLSIDLYNYDQGIIYRNLNWWEEQTQEELDVVAKINELQAYLETLNTTCTDKYKEPINQEIKDKVKEKYQHNAIDFNNNWINYYNSRRNNYLNIDDIYDNNSLFTNHTDDGIIKCASDVFDHFDDKLQQEIYKCRSYHQAKIFIESLYDEYTTDEIWIIWTTIRDKFDTKKGLVRFDRYK